MMIIIIIIIMIITITTITMWITNIIIRPTTAIATASTARGLLPRP